MSDNPSLENTTTNNQHTFNYPWQTVIKGFWKKYPSKRMSNVKLHKVIDMELLPDGRIYFKKLMYFKGLYFFWAYTIEEITVDAKNKILDMKSRIIKDYKVVKPSGLEVIQYKEVPEDINKTLYTKKIFSPSIIEKVTTKMDFFFKVGTDIVTERCEEITKSMNGQNNENQQQMRVEEPKQ